MQKKFHYVYKITRFDGKFYIGVHSTDNLSDNYFGSGRKIIRSVKYHGKNKHKKEIISFFSSKQEALNREAILVNEEILKDANCLNIILGGGTAYNFSQEAKLKLSKSLKGRPKPPGFAEKLRQANLGKRLAIDDPAREKMRKAKLGKKLSYEHIQAQNVGKTGIKHSAEANARKSQRMIGIPLPQTAKAKLHKPCTVDGIIIFPSRLALIEALGHGKAGMGSPTFRYI